MPLEAHLLPREQLALFGPCPCVRLMVAVGLWLIASSGYPGDMARQKPAQPVLPADVVPIPADLIGELEVLHEDYPDYRTRTRHFVITAQGVIELRFQGQPPELPSGTRVHAHGMQTGRVLAVDSRGISTIAVLKSAAVPNTLGEQRTLVILVNFQDKPTEQPWTREQIRSLVFTDTSNFFRENSYQQTWLAGDVVGWYTLPVLSTVCDSAAIRDYAEGAAAAAGISVASYPRRVYAFPTNSACGFGGSSTVGGNPSRSWINGSANMNLATVGHELGHSLGLNHSHSWVCDNGTSLMAGTCSALEYGDGLDVMGWSDSGHFNAFQKERLGWLNNGVSPPITTVTTSGTYAVAPYESTGTAPKALKILKRTDPAAGSSEWYYVEFRQPIGFDSYLASSGGAYQLVSANILNGVTIRWASEASGNSSRLLDMTPGSVDPYSGTIDLYANDPALTIGNSFADADAGVTLNVVSVGSSGASVSVTLANPSCARSNPSIAISPSQSSGVVPGTAVTYTVSVTNNDGTGCTASIFGFATMVPWTGWTATFATPTLTLNPGAVGVTAFNVASSSSSSNGTYGLSITATNNMNTSFAATGSASYVIGSTASVPTTTLSVSISTDQPAYTGGQTVSVTAKALSGGSPVPGASVNFKVTKSNGSVVSESASTDATGSAVGKFRLKRQDPLGGYNARADAAKTQLTGSAVTSFMVVR